jgi:hypothetical protein
MRSRLDDRIGAVDLEPWNRRQSGVLVLLLAVGAALRIYGLTDHGLWIDEYGTWWAIAGETWGDCWNRVVEIHGQSPLYYFIVRLSAEALGVSPASLRLPSLLAGLGLLALAYPLAQQLFRDRRISLLCGAAFAVNPFLIYYSQEARPYGVALLLGTASFYFHVAAVDRGRVRDHAAAVAANALAFYLHYLFGVLMLAQLAHLVVRRPRSVEAWSRWIGHWAAVTVLIVPGLFQLRSLFARREGLSWITDVGPWAGFEIALDQLDPIAMGVVVATVVVALFARRLRKPPTGAHIALPLLWFAIPLLAFGLAAPLAGVQLNHARYLVMVTPAVPLLVGLLLGLPVGGVLWRHAPVGLFLVLVIALRIVPQVQRTGGIFWYFYQHSWDAAALEISERYRDGDVILYRTGFVELDAVVRGTASAATRQFAEWPLVAHLPPEREFERLALPYSPTPEMMRILAGQIRAVRARRVWLVGLDPVDSTGGSFEGLLKMARRGRIVDEKNYRLVGLFLIR